MIGEGRVLAAPLPSRQADRARTLCDDPMTTILPVVAGSGLCVWRFPDQGGKYAER